MPHYRQSQLEAFTAWQDNDVHPVSGCTGETASRTTSFYKKQSINLHFPQTLVIKLWLSKYFIQMKHILNVRKTLLLWDSLGLCLFRFICRFQHDEYVLVPSTIKGQKGPETATKALSLLASWEELMFWVSLYCLFTPCTICAGVNMEWSSLQQALLHLNTSLSKRLQHSLLQCAYGQPAREETLVPGV